MAQNKSPLLNVKDLDENLARLRQALSSDDKVLITNETFAQPLFSKSKRGHAYDPLWCTMAEILENAGATDVTIVVYLRRQDDWVSSRWRQAIKRNHEMRPLSEYCDKSMIRCSLNYANLLETACSTFKSETRLIVRPYDKADFEGGDIYHDFCSAVGIPWDDGYQIPEFDCNPSLSFDVAEALRQCSAPLPLGTYWPDSIIPLAQKLSGQDPDPPGTTPFDEEATRAFMEPYLKGNELISQRYRGGKPLFSEEYGGRPVWMPDEERIAEYRAILQEAIRQHEPARTAQAQPALESANHPRSISQSLKAMRRKLLGA